MHLRNLGAADLNMFILPPVGRACSEADMQLTVCRVLLAAGIKPAYRSSTASKLALGLVASGWLLGCARAHSQAAPTSQLQQRPCGTQDGAVTTSVTPATLPSTLRTSADHSELILQPFKAVQSVDRLGLVRVAVQDHCPLCSRQSRDAISGPDDAVVAESPSQGIYHTIPNVCCRR